ncbi:MAG: rhodanese-like domain-containing protein [Kineosporiaceae bacterium]
MTYAGDLTPEESFTLLTEAADAVLVDVRTAAEWAYVGLPDLSSLGRDVLRIEWVRYPDGARNEGFVAELTGAGVAPQAPVLFLCRSGVRSKGAAAAATAAGYSRAYNIVDGFEGQLDAAGHRGVGGWKSAGLPWRQS